MKKCPKCNEIKDESEFYVKKYANGTIGLRSYCKACGAAERDKWRKACPRDNERNKQYNKENAHIIRGNKLTKYWPGTDWKQATENYNKLLESQNGLCALCEKKERRVHPLTGTIWDLAVDHCHVTNRVRGLLCNACNRGLGLLKDSIEGLERAVKYLKKECA